MRKQMKTIALNAAVKEKFEIVKWNIQSANEEKMTNDLIMEILMELYWSVLKPSETKISYEKDLDIDDMEINEN